MSDYLVHLAIFIAIILLGIEATVILIRNGASWLLMLLFAVVFLGAGMLEEGYDTAFAWLMPDAITEQAQFFDIEWRPKITALLLRSWMWVFFRKTGGGGGGEGAWGEAEVGAVDVWDGAGRRDCPCTLGVWVANDFRSASAREHRCQSGSTCQLLRVVRPQFARSFGRHATA